MSLTQPKISLLLKLGVCTVVVGLGTNCSFGSKPAVELFETVDVSAGAFHMGCSPEDAACYTAEKPTHPVIISHNLQVMTTEVSQKLYRAVINTNPSVFQSCADCPVERVNWFDTIVFANALSEEVGLQSCYVFNDAEVHWPNPNCTGWRLPTEAEWEYLARGGSQHFLPGDKNIKEIAWYGDNSLSQTHPVGSKSPNAYGIYDLSGNVWEWVWDNYADYKSQSVEDPRGGKDPSLKVIRGGSWISMVRDLRLSGRDSLEPENSASILGFRLVRTVK